MASLRRGRRGRKAPPRPAGIVFAGLLTVAVLGAFIWLAENAYNGLPFLSYRTVYAEVPNIGHLIPHDPVDIAGVRVGQVLNTTTRDNRPVAELQLQGVGPLPTNSTVIVRADGLLGARYVQLTPGTAKTYIPNGGMLKGGSGTFYDGVPEWLNLFDPKTRSAIGYMLNGLGEGVQGRGAQLNQAIHVGPTSGANFDAAAYAILGRGGSVPAADFLPFTDAGVTALDIARNDIAGTFHPANQALQPLISERSQVQTLIDDMPSAEAAIDRGFQLNRGYQVLVNVQRIANLAKPLLPKVPGALTSATELLHAASSPTPTGAASDGSVNPSPLQATEQVLNQVPAAAPATLSTLAALKPDLAPLTQDFTKLVGPVSQLAIHGCDIQNFASATRSMVSWGGEPSGNYGPFVGFPISLIVSPQSAGFLTSAGGSYPTQDYYPAPCAYSPGATFTDASLLQVLSTAFPAQ